MRKALRAVSLLIIAPVFFFSWWPIYSFVTAYAVPLYWRIIGPDPLGEMVPLALFLLLVVTLWLSWLGVLLKVHHKFIVPSIDFFTIPEKSATASGPQSVDGGESDESLA
jgi:hypothetical protein